MSKDERCKQQACRETDESLSRFDVIRGLTEYIRTPSEIEFVFYVVFFLSATVLPIMRSFASLYLIANSSRPIKSRGFPLRLCKPSYLHFNFAIQRIRDNTKQGQLSPFFITTKRCQFSSNQTTSVCAKINLFFSKDK